MICTIQRYAFQEVQFDAPDDVVAKAKAGDEDARQTVRDAGIEAIDKENPPFQWDSTHWLDADDDEIDSH